MSAAENLPPNVRVKYVVNIPSRPPYSSGLSTEVIEDALRYADAYYAAKHNSQGKSE